MWITKFGMMLRYSFDLDEAADKVEAAIRQVIEEGYRTVDIMSEGKTLVNTAQIGDLICERIA